MYKSSSIKPYDTLSTVEWLTPAFSTQTMLPSCVPETNESHDMVGARTKRKASVVLLRALLSYALGKGVS